VVKTRSVPDCKGLNHGAFSAISAAAVRANQLPRVVSRTDALLPSTVSVSMPSRLCGSIAGSVGDRHLMSHHMSNLTRASDDECLSLVAFLAFERAAFDALYVHRFDQSDRSLPAACGA
jgi:hypothetical protein